MKMPLSFIALALPIIFLDLLTKHLSAFVKGCWLFFCIQQSSNRGAAFGLLSTFSWALPLLIVIGIIVISLCAFFYFKTKAKVIKIGLSLLFAGTAGNLIDRAIFGYVVDWIVLFTFPAFNLADCSNVVGALILIYGLGKRNKQKNKAKFL